MHILNYTNSVLAPLRELMVQEKIANLPEIQLKENTDVHLITSSISTAAFTQDATSSPKAKIISSFGTIIDFFEDDNNILRTQSTDQIAKALGTILENSHKTIVNEIGSMVTDLRESIETAFVAELKAEKADDLLDSNVTITEGDYTFLKWENLRTPARQNEIITQACENASLTNQILSITNLGYIIEKMAFSSEVADVAVTAEGTEAILGELNKTFTSETYGIGTQRIDRLLKVATSKSAYTTFCATLYSQMKKPTETAANTIFLIQLVNDFHVVMRRIKVVVADHVSSDSLSTFSNNVQAVGKTLMAVQYFCLYNKEKRFKDRLVLTRNIINNEMYQAFVKSGKTVEDIHNYLKANYRTAAIPLNGITFDTIASTDVSEKLVIAAATNKANGQFLRSKCLINAYNHTMNEFAKQIMEENLFGYEDDRTIIKRFAMIAKSSASHFNGNIGKVDDVLYDVLIKTFYHQDLIATVFKYLRNSISDLTQSTESIDDQGIIDAEVNASIFLLVDFLYDQLTVHRDGFKGSSPHE